MGILKTMLKGFTEECAEDQNECCFRITWNDDCLADWDLWVRERTEPGTPSPSDKWVSYLNLGPVGETRMELHADVENPGAEGDLVAEPVNICSIPDDPTTGSIAAEMVCLCIGEDMNYPKTFDIVVNLFGTDSSCPSPLGDVCVEYLGANTDDTEASVFFDDTISGVFTFQAKGTFGNFGNGDFRQPTLKIEEFPGTDSGDPCGAADLFELSTCWLLTGVRSNGKAWSNRGGGRAPSRFIIPDDVAPGSCKLFEDGKLVDRGRYQLATDSEADRLGLERTNIAKARRYSGNDAKARSKKCKKKRCGKRKGRKIL